MNKELNIEIYLEIKTNKINFKNLEIKFNNIIVPNLLYDINKDLVRVIFSVNETTEISKSVLEIKNTKDKDPVWIKKIFINAFDCSKYFNILDNKLPIIKSQNTVSFIWTSPYAYYFLKRF